MNRYIVTTVTIVTIAFLKGIFPLFSQNLSFDYQSLVSQKELWDAERIYMEVLRRSQNHFRYSQRHFISILNDAIKQYSTVPIFHAYINKEDDVVTFNIESNDFPMDVVYVKGKTKIKLIDYNDANGEGLFFDTIFLSNCRGFSKRMNSSFKYILRQNPELIFVNRDYYACFLREEWNNLFM